MDFVFTTEQAALADSLGRYAQDRYGFATGLVRGHASEAPGHWAELAELGWLGAGLSEAEGGFGGGPVEAAIVAEAFGRALVVEPYVPAAIQAPRTLLALGASPDSLAPIVWGELRYAVAVTEGGGRGDPRHVTLRAEAVPGRFRLSGRKRMVLGGPNADRFLVSARTGDAPGAGVSLFDLPAEHAGLEMRRYRLVDRRAVCDLIFDDTPVPAEAMVGQPGAALPAILAGVDHALIALCAETLGAMEAALWMTRDYLQTRRQFGQPIGRFQALQHRMADMLIETELARSMLYQGLHALGQDATARAQGVAAAKAFIARAGLFVGRQAIQLHGGIGMTEELAVGHYYKRIMANAGLFGDSDLHVERYAEAMTG